MIKFSKSIYIERPPEEVFEFSADPSNAPEWRDSAVSGQWLSEGPIGAGSKFKSVDRLLGREIESTSEITAWDPPRSYGQKAMDGPVPFEMTVRLEPKTGGTQVTLDGQAEVGGFFKIAEGLAGRQLQKQIESDLAGLKRALEEGQG